MRNSEWTKILGWPGYRVYQHEVDERAKALKLWVRRKSGNRRLICSGCGQRVSEIHEVYEREVRDLACFEFRTTVVIELYRIRCPWGRIGAAIVFIGFNLTFFPQFILGYLGMPRRYAMKVGPLPGPGLGGLGVLRGR